MAEYTEEDIQRNMVLSDKISRDLKKRGFKYLGSVTVYSHLQACGMINDHTEGCFRYQEVMEGRRVVDAGFTRLPCV